LRLVGRGMLIDGPPTVRGTLGSNRIEHSRIVSCDEAQQIAAGGSSSGMHPLSEIANLDWAE
jgi:hypothetical protein